MLVSSAWQDSSSVSDGKLRLTLRNFLRISFHIAFAVTALSIFELSSEPKLAITLIGVALCIYVVWYQRADYTNTFVAFVMPWLLMIGFSLVPLSEYAIDIHKYTYRLVLVAIFAAMMGSALQGENHRLALHWAPTLPAKVSVKKALHLVDGCFWGFTVLNVALAGYVPLVRGIMTGDTGYVDFGVHGLYGFYVAFANALAVFNFFLFLRTGRRVFLYKYLSILLIFILFVTRQNVISAIIESLIVYSVLRGQVRRRVLVILLTAGLVAFSLIGLFRSGSIKTLSGTRPAYLWVPDPVIWLYAYFYFNIANLDNLMHFSKAPFFDGSSFAILIPSFLRPDFNSEDYLQMPLFNVSSYLYPLYQDMGTGEVIMLTFTAIWITRRVEKKMNREASLFLIGSFATLYFCAAFSFFVNFWLYLPVIFQVLFFKVLSNLSSRVVLELNSPQMLSPTRRNKRPLLHTSV